MVAVYETVVLENVRNLGGIKAYAAPRQLFENRTWLSPPC
jgi:hypothetical protein